MLPKGPSLQATRVNVKIRKINAFRTQTYILLYIYIYILIHVLCTSRIALKEVCKVKCSNNDTYVYLFVCIISVVYANTTVCEEINIASSYTSAYGMDLSRKE